MGAYLSTGVIFLLKRTRKRKRKRTYFAGVSMREKRKKKKEREKTQFFSIYMRSDSSQSQYTNKLTLHELHGGTFLAHVEQDDLTAHCRDKAGSVHLQVRYHTLEGTSMG